MLRPPRRRLRSAAAKRQYSRVARPGGAVSSPEVTARRRRSPNPCARVIFAAPGAARGLLQPGVTDGSCGGGRVNEMKRLWIAGTGGGGRFPGHCRPSRDADWRVSVGVARYDGYGRRLEERRPGLPVRVRPGLARGLGGGPSDGRRPRDPRFWRERRVPGRRPRLQAAGWARGWDVRRGLPAAGYEAGYRRAYAGARPEVARPRRPRPVSPTTDSRGVWRRQRHVRPRFKEGTREP